MTLAELLELPNRRLGFLLELDAYNRTSEAEETLRFSNFGFISAPGDTPANTEFEARLLPRGRIRRALPTDRLIAGLALSSLGEYTLSNAGGGLDYLLDYAVDGRAYRWLVGDMETAASLTDFFPLPGGKMRALQVGMRHVKVIVRDLNEVVDRDIETDTYGGTGGTDGTADLAGKPKPNGWGKIFNCPGVLVDTTNRIWQLHNGQINQVLACRIGGVAKATPADYTVDAANGRAALTADPSNAEVRWDFEGDASGAGYVSTGPDIIRRILVDKLGVAAGEIDDAAFDALAAAQPAVMGVWVGAEQTPGRDVLQHLLESGGMGLTDDFAGQITIGRLTRPTGDAAVELTHAEILAGRLELIEQRTPTQEWSIGYERNYGPQDEANLDVSVSLANRQRYGADIRYKSSSDSAVLTADPEAPRRSIDAAFADADDAADEAARRQVLHGVPRGLWRAPVRGIGLMLGLFDVVKITLARMGLDEGRFFRLVGVDIDLAQKSVALILWGHVSGYLLWAPFDADDQAFTDGQVIDTRAEGVKEGSLTVVDTSDGAVTIANEKLALTAPSTPAWDQVAVKSGAVIENAIGRAVIVKAVNTATGTYGPDVGWWKTGVVVAERGPVVNFNPSGAVLLIDDTYIGSGLNIGSFAAATDYDLALIKGGYNASGVPYQPGDNKADFGYGVAVLIKGGAYARWTLLYRAHHDWSGGVRSGAMTHGSDCTIGEINVWDADFTALLEHLVLDTFTDADSTDLADHTPDIDQIGGGWTSQVGTIEILSNQAEATATASPGPTYTLDCGSSDYVAEMLATGNGTVGPRLVFRYSDNDNFWIVQGAPNTDAFSITERQSGSWINRASAAPAINDNVEYAYRLIADGESLVAMFADNTRIAYGSATLNKTSTLIGVGGTTTGVKINHLAVSLRVAGAYDALDAR